MGNRYLKKLKKLALQPAYLWGKPAAQAAGKQEKNALPRGDDITLDAGFAPTFGNKPAVLTIVSDDGDFGTGKALHALTREFGIPVTVAGTVTNIGLQEDWWKRALNENPLLELVSHSYNHARMGETDRIAKSRLRLRHEIAHSIRYFERHFGEKQICFVCPENKMCALGYEILHESGIDAVRRGGRGNNPLWPENGKRPGEWYHLRSRGIMDHTGDDAETLRREEVQSAVAERAWLIEMWHNVCEKDDGAYQTILLPDAKKHLAYLKERSDAGELWTAKLSDAVKYAFELERAKLITKKDGDTLCIYASVETDEPAVYDHPLTVCFQAPEGYAVAEAPDIHRKDDFCWIDVLPNTAARIPLKKL